MFAALMFVGKWMISLIADLVKSKDEMAQQMIDKVLPTLTETAVVVSRAMELIQELDEGRRRRPRDGR